MMAKYRWLGWSIGMAIYTGPLVLIGLTAVYGPMGGVVGLALGTVLVVTGIPLGLYRHDRISIQPVGETPVTLSKRNWERVVSEIYDFKESLSAGESKVARAWNQSHMKAIEAGLRVAPKVTDRLQSEWRQRQAEAVKQVVPARWEVAEDHWKKKLFGAMDLCITAQFASQSINSYDRELLLAPYRDIRELVRMLRCDPAFSEFAEAVVADWTGSLDDLFRAAQASGCWGTSKTRRVRNQERRRSGRAAKVERWTWGRRYTSLSFEKVS